MPRTGVRPCEGTQGPPALLCPGAALTHCQEKHTPSSSLKSKEDKPPSHHHYTTLCLSVSPSCLSVSLCVSLSHTHTQRFGAHLKGNFPHLLSRDCFSFSHFSKNKKTKNTSCQMAQPSQLSPPEGSLRSAKPLELTVSPGTGREEVWGQGRESRTVRGPHSLRYPVNPWPLWARRNLRPTGGSEIFMTRTKSQRPRKRKGAPWAP